MSESQKVVKALALLLAFSICLGIISFTARCVGFVFSVFLDDYDYRQNEPMDDEQSSVYLGDIPASSIDEVIINIKRVNLEVREGSEFSVVKKGVDGKIFDSVQGGTLRIEEKGNSWLSSHAGTLLVTIPKDADIEKLSIDQGAGTIEVVGITAREFDFDQGAGKTTITGCSFKYMDVDGGVGKSVIKETIIDDLDFDSGVGEVDIEADIRGDVDIDGGVGSIKLKVLGQKEDFRFRIEKGLGSITVDGTSSSGNFGNGDRLIQIDGGVGSIKVEFQGA